MASYTATLRYLYGLQWRGMKFGLRNTRILLDAAGHPERCFPTIHIAGTNGKGSTAAFLASAVTAAGYRAGLYTSPHLRRFTERIRINGKELSESQLVYYVNVLRPAIESVRATFFEATTCIAFLYFADEGIDLGIIETGLGGRFDATNVLRPLASVITNVGLDHTEYLGTTLTAIAREKGGIIKPGVPVVTGSSEPAVLAVLRKIARLRRAAFWQADSLIRRAPGRSKGVVSFHGRQINIRAVRPALPGAHQLENAQLAVAVLEVLSRRARFHRRFPAVTEQAIRKGLMHVRRNTGLRGRLEQVGSRGEWILDVAHNPPGIEKLIASLREAGIVPAAAVFGVMKDKDYRAMLAVLSHAVPLLVAVSPRMERALPSHTLLRMARRAGAHARLGGSVARGMSLARRLVGPSGPILITGSHYVVASALEFLEPSRT